MNVGHHTRRDLHFSKRPLFWRIPAGPLFGDGGRWSQSPWHLAKFVTSTYRPNVDQKPGENGELWGTPI